MQLVGMRLCVLGGIKEDHVKELVNIYVVYLCVTVSVGGLFQCFFSKTM